MVAQPGKEEAKKHLKFVESEDEDGAPDIGSSSESEDNTPTDPTTLPTATAGAAPKKAKTGKGKRKPKSASAGGVVAGGRKAKRKAAANVAALNFGPSLSAKKAKSAAANPTRDKAVDKALAQQATSIPIA